MKVKLEIPIEDFKKLIDGMDGDNYTYACINVRNQIVEEGGYQFRIQKEKAYSHDLGKFIEKGKVVITIDTTPPK